MSSLHNQIKMALRREKVVFSVHADNRLQERGVVRWQVIEGFARGELIHAYPAAKPNPKILLKQRLADGSEVITIWSVVESIQCAKLVTVYFEVRR